jgi:protein-L-isoaspartate(D-aspartate) O-methyltransferase
MESNLSQDNYPCQGIYPGNNQEDIVKIKVLFLSFFLLVMLPWIQGHAAQDQYLKARERMVEKDLKSRDITDKKVLSVMGKVPRHLFIEKDLWDVAYNDYPLSIGEGQTISQPYIVALMTQHLKLQPTDRVLEIGTGSAYQAAVLAELVEKVYSIEIKKELAQKAAVRLKDLGYNNVTVKHGDGYFGWPEQAPFDAIIVTCAPNHIPPKLTKQLNEGGRLIIPVGNTRLYQYLILITKVKGELKEKKISGVRFVPMTGEAQKK